MAKKLLSFIISAAASAPAGTANKELFVRKSRKTSYVRETYLA
jgi:hypothetical protein